VAISHRLAQPGVPADVDINRAVERTDAALHAARWIGHNLTRYQCLAAGCIVAE